MAPTTLEVLSRFGHLPKTGPETSATLDGSYSPRDVEKAMESYRRMVGAPETMDWEDVTDIPRCGVADFEGVAYTDQNGIYQDTGSGSWPAGCHPEWPRNHSFAVFFDMRSFPPHWADVFEEAWDLVVRSYKRIGIAFFRVLDRARANTIVTWEMSTRWLGLAIVGRGVTCRSTIWAKYENRYGRGFARDRLINQLAMLMGHEFGHNMGLGHTIGGVMNASLSSFAYTAEVWVRDPAFNTLRRWFSGNPVAEQDPIWGIPQPEQPRE